MTSVPVVDGPPPSDRWRLTDTADEGVGWRYDEQDPILPMAVLLGRPRDDSGWLLGGLLRTGEAMAIAGPRSVGKSTLALQLAADLARGDGMFLERFPVSKPDLRVLLIGGELTERDYKDRRHLLGEEVPRRFAVWDPDRDMPAIEVGDVFEEDPEERVRWRLKRARLSKDLDAAIEHFRPDVIIIDPWASVFEGAENDNDDVKAAIKVLDGWRRRTGASYVIVHHHREGGYGDRNADPEDLARGASRLMDAMTVRISLTRTGTNGKKMSRDASTTDLRIDILNRHEATLSGRIVRADGLGAWRWHDPSPAPAGLTTVAGLDLNDVHARLAAAGPGGWASARQAGDALGVTGASAGRALDALVARHRAERVIGARGAKGYRARP